MPINDSIETLYVHVTGRVQGVGFRLATVRRAHMIGVRGWVQNNLDGSVEAMLQGSVDQVDQMLTWMHKGPPGSLVRELRHETRDIDRRFDRFEQR